MFRPGESRLPQGMPYLVDRRPAAIGRLLPVDDRTDSFRQQLLAKRFFVGESRLVTIGGDNLQGKTWGRNWIAPQNKRGVGVRPLGMGSGCD